MADSSGSSSAASDLSESTSEITLYKDNKPLLKAECGVTLGLLKLIYSSDDSYNGVLLGVKPRLSNGSVPCLVTFDNTQLTHPGYDLIVHAAPSALDIQKVTCREPQINTSPQRSLISTVGDKSSCNRDHTQESRHPPVSSASTQIANEEISSDTLNDYSRPSTSSTNQSAALHPESSSQEQHPPSQQKLGSSEKLLYMENDCNDPPDSTVEECEAGGFAVISSIGEIHDPDTKAPEEIEFKPEEFNFDIGSVVPFKSEKGTRWPCNCCGKDFCSSSHLKRHWIVHTDFKPYKCNVCGKCFPFQWDLKKHMTKHTGNKPFKCALCPKSFNTQEERRNHNWLHTGKKEYECHVCHHEFSSHGNLKIHMRKHTGETPYKCEYCPKSFYMLGHYQYHIRRHTGEKPYTCDFCGKAFSYSNNLKEHRNVHTGHRPYSCSQCEKKFTHRSTFKQHVLIHQGNKRYKCHVCSKSFVQCSNYQRHILTHKTKKERVQKCDLCGKELLSRRGVQKHRLRCVKKTVERANASEVRSRKKSQSKRGKFGCEHCPRIFTYSRWLEVHVSKKHSTSTEDCSDVTKKHSTSAEGCSNVTKKHSTSSEDCTDVTEKHSTSSEDCTDVTKKHSTSAEDCTNVTKKPSTSTEDSTIKPTVKSTIEQATNSALASPKKIRRKRGEYRCQHCPKIFAYSRRLEAHVKEKHSPSTADRTLKTTVTLVSSNRQLLQFQCFECGRRFGYVKRLRDHQVKDHQRATSQGSSSTAVPQTGASQTTTFHSRYVSILPKSADSESNPHEVKDLKECPAGTVPRVIHPENSQPTSGQAANRYLHPDGRDGQQAGETGFEALSALIRLSRL